MFAALGASMSPWLATPIALGVDLKDLTVGERLSQYPWVYILMPIVAAVIGYVTKLAALRMIFEPLEYKGIGPIGWQGIVPRRAPKMATITVDKLTGELISLRELADKVDASRLVKEIEGPLMDAVDRIARDVFTEYQAGLWESLPEYAKKLVINQLKGQVPGLVKEFTDDAKENLEEIIDLKHMAVRALVRDKKLLNEIFKRIGHKEFKFIAHSGIYFGFAIGLIQAATFLFVPQWWVLPAFGLLVGLSTDWLALKMLFVPTEPKKILGVTFQGLFLKRQQEVAGDYAELIAQEVLTPSIIYEELLTGPASDRLYDMILQHINEAARKQAGLAQPLVVLGVGSRRYQDMKRRVATNFMAKLPETLKAAEEYTTEAVDVKNTLRTKMQGMTSKQFEGMLRPVFRQDEKTVILVGAALGFVVGLSQDTILVPLFEKL